MSRDLMHSAEIKDVVRRAYRGIDRSTAAVAERFYGSEDLVQVPRSAIDRALGVANHLRFAEIEPGETVLDIGCGGGIDTVLAARRTGPSGRVIALDFLAEFGPEDVREVLLRLPQLYRAPLVLVYMEGYATKEVAAMLDAPIGTILARLHRGRKLFERQMWEYAEKSGLLREAEQ